MEKSKSINTIQREHWAVDTVFTQNANTSFSNLIYSSIENKIENSHKKIESNTCYAPNKDDFNIEMPLNNSYGQDKSYFQISQKWIGNVIEIYNDCFIAKLIDKTNKGTYEIGEFEIKEISEDDKSLLKIGSTFYLSIGYMNDRNGQKSKSNILRFQRLANWTEEEMFNAIDAANELNESINWTNE